LVAKAIIVTSADGRTITTASDIDGNGTVDQSKSDVTVVNDDGRTVETLTTRNGNGSLRDNTVTTTSADQRVVTVTTDLDGDGRIDRQETITIQQDGTQVDAVSYFNRDGSFKDEKVTRTSADGLSQTVARAPFVLDASFTGGQTTSDTVVLNADGGRTDTFTDRDSAGNVKELLATTTNANGLVKTTHWTGTNGRNAIDQTQADATTLNADGSQTQRMTSSTAAGVLQDQRSITTSGNMLTKTDQVDVDGNGSFERVDACQYLLGGGKIETVTRFNPLTGALQQQDVTTTSADHRSISLQRDFDGDGIVDHQETSDVNSDGS